MGLLAMRAEERCRYSCRYLRLVRSAGMPIRIYKDPSPESTSEITVLEQMITSVSDRLDGLDEDDPAARPLREHLGELTARRDLLVREREDSWNKRYRQAIWLWLVCDVIAIGGLASALADLTGARTSPVPLSSDVAGLVFCAVLLLFCAPPTFKTWSEIREYRRTHAGERL
jgi:hypothetical protein